MSIDNYYWYPAGANDANPYPKGYVKARSASALPKGKKVAAHIYFSHGQYFLVDEHYFFEEFDSAFWFWSKGWEGRQFLDADGAPVGWGKYFVTARSAPRWL